MDPYTVLLADSERGMGDFELGIVVTGDGKVYQYTFEWPGTLHEKGTFMVWKDITASWQYITSPSQRVPHRELVSAAIDILATGR